MKFLIVRDRMKADSGNIKNIHRKAGVVVLICVPNPQESEARGL
jgi:hypothetical protein